MDRLLRRALLAFCILMVMAYSVVQAEEYRLGPGDVLSIGVYGYEELQVKELAIRPDGRISFPLVGELKVESMTPAELTDALTVRLAFYVKDPRVIVNLDKLRTIRVYVLGEVSKPGMYEIQRRHNVLDAIGAAGGFTQNTAKRRVFILKQGQPDHPIVINLLKLLQRADMSQNIALADGDVVYLTDNHKINFARDIMPFISAVYQISEIND